MELFIRVQNGQPFEHPIMSDNFRQAFPDVDTNNLPAEFARFVRVEPPIVGPYEKNQTVSYQLVDGAYTDVFTVEQMTAEEIATKQQATKDAWATIPFPIPSWVFDEATCTFIPPTPMPTDGKQYRWIEETTSWAEIGVTNV